MHVQEIRRVNETEAFVFDHSAGPILITRAAVTQAAAFLYAVDKVDISIRLLETATGAEISPKTPII